MILQLLHINSQLAKNLIHLCALSDIIWFLAIFCQWILVNWPSLLWLTRNLTSTPCKVPMKLLQYSSSSSSVMLAPISTNFRRKMRSHIIESTNSTVSFGHSDSWPVSYSFFCFCKNICSIVSVSWEPLSSFSGIKSEFISIEINRT